MSPKAFLVREYSGSTFVYNIDIVGTCNLACASCPVGNVRRGDADRGIAPKGFMPLGRFSEILTKVLREAPVPLPTIALYNWGEPLLHPDIGKIVALVRSHDLYCAVSTNLNQARFLEDLVQAGPSHIKISVSGFTQGTYGRTHARGRIDVVKGNMRRLRTLMDTCGQAFEVFVGYHDYIGNDGAEVESLTALATELGFGVRHKVARLYPLERVLPLYEGGEPDTDDRPVHDLLLVKPREWGSIARRLGEDRTCMMREQEMAINYDGTVALCCNVFDYRHNIAPDFLTTEHRHLQDLKAQHTLCGRCTAAGYPGSCGLDEDADVRQLAGSRASRALAPIGADLGAGQD